MKKTDKNKQLILEQLKKTPIIELACQKSEIGRSTYYYWYNNDLEFAKQADEALKEGVLLIDDLAESQLLSLIKEKNWPAISFWLRYHHPKYAQRLEVTAELNQKQEELTPEQAETVREALRLASLIPAENLETENNSNNNN
jgi:hypothetical protein